MDFYWYLLIFMLGTLFGSFYALAIYRIPKRQDIIHTHSYCPNCNVKLKWLDLIPIISYISLRGKCRYCKHKIKPMYFFLELFSGILFIGIAIFVGCRIETLNSIILSRFCLAVLYVTFLILIAGIDRQTRKIDKLVSIYGMVIAILYMLYVCFVEQGNVNRYLIYLICYIIILFLDTIILRKHAKNSYVTGILLMVITMVIFTTEFVTIHSILLTLLSISFYLLISKIKRKRSKIKSEKQIADHIRIGFFLTIGNLLTLLLFVH